ncbi:uncharacterized protein LOC103701713 [Phoenix dactylifera]|uniref:Uncharacterized protein LOC103701713 n=1 Tax=Phoenix dactylifera TaxID=42345 RepID=A0A8B7BNF8_PHODC|nr:uncharacterized protein LOC103701713 [Phoenix dactylifera]
MLLPSLQSPPPPLRRPSFPYLHPSPSLSRNPAVLSPRTLITRRPLFFRLRSRPPAALPATDQELLKALVGSSDDAVDEARTHLPAVRSYEGDLARLTLVGAVSYDQALTAAAADGGDAAEEHLSSGKSTMVVEAVYPGSADEHSTVSTRLFLPAKKVKEKAKTLRSSLTAHILSSSPTVSNNILAMTFRQVVLQRLWSFQLSLFGPGTKRNMKDLASPREVPTDVAVSSSDERFLSSLAEAICSCVLEDTEANYHGRVGDLPSNSIFGWLQKPRQNCSIDSSICINRISEGEILRNARKHVDKFNLVKGKSLDRGRKMKHRWWAPPSYSSLVKYRGPGFSDWTSEFIPAYRLQINHTFKDTKLEGWQKLADNRWEVLLTHFQMVELANILDMYYEDRYTLPDKQLSYNLVTKSSNVSRNKSSAWKMIFVTLAGGFIVLLISVLAQVCWPHLQKSRKALEQNTSVSLSETDCCHLQLLEAAELEALCVSVVKKIKDALGWPGDIMFDANLGAWTGKLPHCLRNNDLISHAIYGSREDATYCPGDVQTNAELSTSISSYETINADAQLTAQDIASFQVVLSGDGKIMGFQPTSRVAVNNWATNPLVKELYGGRKLSPGLLEPTLKIPRPHEVVLIELLMSVTPESSFALARPIEQSR